MTFPCERACTAAAGGGGVFTWLPRTVGARTVPATYARYREFGKDYHAPSRWVSATPNVNQVCQQGRQGHDSRVDGSSCDGFRCGEKATVRPPQIDTWIVAALSFNDHALRRKNEAVKDALIPMHHRSGKSGIAEALRGNAREDDRRTSPLVVACGLSWAVSAAETSPPAAQYKELCGMCHQTNGMGVGILARRPGDTSKGMLEDRTDLGAAFVKVVVRNGIVNMPRISRGEVSDAQLDAIATIFEVTMTMIDINTDCRQFLVGVRSPPLPARVSVNKISGTAPWTRACRERVGVLHDTRITSLRLAARLAAMARV